MTEPLPTTSPGAPEREPASPPTASAAAWVIVVLGIAIVLAGFVFLALIAT